ncbi:hypothetical protein HCH_00689 [Hahella chejuensis KCTC 2396]|uniref:Uncharacterized protein n=1 Tax=Hahella chejuensis (strain KCTC 2396) TaxID=349521 RepID=Q2SP36_HAHCH|nr:hypothetical protein HCH_00689 [Hahella chejuensis KCTC 2396]
MFHGYFSFSFFNDSIDCIQRRADVFAWLPEPETQKVCRFDEALGTR